MRHERRVELLERLWAAIKARDAAEKALIEWVTVGPSGRSEPGGPVLLRDAARAYAIDMASGAMAERDDELQGLKQRLLGMDAEGQRPA